MYKYLWISIATLSTVMAAEQEGMGRQMTSVGPGDDDYPSYSSIDPNFCKPYMDSRSQCQKAARNDLDSCIERYTEILQDTSVDNFQNRGFALSMLNGGCESSYKSEIAKCRITCTLG
jgi:hypothetical protein